jgi:hypothetical protein
MATQKHSQIRNKREDQVKINEDQWNSPTRSRKNYVTAKKKATKSLTNRNNTVEGMYHAVLKSVKELYKTLPNKEDRVIMEMNMKLHPLDGEQMYAFMTPHFLFFLECDVICHFRIEYYLADCKLEAEIRAIMKKFLIGSFSNEPKMIHNYPEFFKEMLRCQPERFITVL